MSTNLGVGSWTAPCILAYPVGFAPEQTDTGDGWYQWKSGFFKPYPMGDVNHDNLVSIVDVTLIVDYILSIHPSNFFIESADVVPDGIISIADVTAIVDIILK